MNFVMLVNRFGRGSNSVAQVSIWEGEIDGQHNGIGSDWFPVVGLQVLIHQLVFADRIKVVGGPEARLTVLHDGGTGFFPAEPLSVSEFIEQLKQKL